MEYLETLPYKMCDKCNRIVPLEADVCPGCQNVKFIPFAEVKYG